MFTSHAAHSTLADRQASDALTVTRYAGIVCLILFIGMLAGWAVIRRGEMLAYAITLIPILVTAAMHPWMCMHGRSRQSAMQFLTAILLALIVTPILMPSFAIPVGGAIAAAIMLAYVLVGSKMARWFAAACVVGLGVSLVINRFFPLDWFGEINQDVMFFLNLISGGFVIAAAAMFVRLIIMEQENYFVQSKEAEQKLADAAAEVRAAQSRVEMIIEIYSNFMVEIANGNMRAHLPVNGNSGMAKNEPLMVLGSDLSDMANNLRDMIVKIKEVGANITSASTEILAANTQQVSSSAETSAAIAQTTTTVDEMKVLAEHVLVRAQEVADAAQRTVTVSQSGRQAVEATIRSMLEIRSKVEGIAESILALSEKTQQIGDIISAVSEIASQSHMLALNASVEAARAGEAGKGFSVVALEMRSLAEQSRKATEQIKGILSEIQQATNSTVMATEEGSKGVDRGVKLAEQARGAIEQLAGSIDESAQTASQMTAGGRQQLTGVEQVVMTMRHINEATAQNVASSRQTEKAAQALNSLAQELEGMIERYRV